MHEPLVVHYRFNRRFFRAVVLKLILRDQQKVFCFAVIVVCDSPDGP